MCSHETGNEILFPHGNNSVFIVFVAIETKKEIHFCFDPLIYYLCFYEIFACADVSFCIMSFRG